MKIKFISPSEVSNNLKATIHKSGKLGFNMDAANRIKLEEMSCAMVGINEEDEDDANLYIMFSKEALEDSYKVSKAGEYFYLNLKNFFEKQKINYEDFRISYTIKEGDFVEFGGFVFERENHEESSGTSDS
ncbi:MAG: hypothetical protein GY816_03940 [Cytophagales bacterium]|nr:hypothetical protein [Cytophagales bacterium]